MNSLFLLKLNIHKVDLELISRPKCNEVNFDRVKNGMICAGTPGGGAGKDACQVGELTHVGNFGFMPIITVYVILM